MQTVCSFSQPSRPGPLLGDSFIECSIDHEQASILDGGSADLGKLNVAVQSLIALLPGRELPAPASQREDPRVKMFEIYMEMRRRGEIGLKALPEGGADARIAELTHENQLLRARLASFAALDVPTSDIVPPGELGTECYAGIRPGPDDPPRRSPPVIEGRAVKRPNPPATSAAPQYDYNREQGWKDYVEADGTIRTTPRGRGHYWGPV
jgi:hypothetical protein